MMYSNGGWDWPWGFVMMILFWGGLVLVVMLLTRGLGARAGRDATLEHHPSPSPPPNPKQTLRDRFARGEIDENEYRQRLRVLEETAT